MSPIEAAEQLIAAVQQLSAVSDLQDVMNITKRAARRMTGASGASFVLRDGNFCYYADEDAVAPLWKGRRFPLDICISGWVMRNRQPTIIDDVFADPRIPHDVYRQTFVKSMAMVPIRSLSPIGAIGIYWDAPHCPGTESVRWLQSLADSTALAVEHLQARLELADEQGGSQPSGKSPAAAAAESHPTRERGNIAPRDSAAHAAKAAGNPCIKMCFITHRLEVDGQWLSIEAFLARRLGLDVTHGLSPAALARLEADLHARLGV